MSNKGGYGFDNDKAFEAWCAGHNKGLEQVADLRQKLAVAVEALGRIAMTRDASCDDGCQCYGCDAKQTLAKIRGEGE